MDDTETLLATLASLFNDNIPNDDLLDALVKSNGDIQLAAEHIRRVSPQFEKRGVKRRRDLSDWITPPQKGHTDSAKRSKHEGKGAHLSSKDNNMATTSTLPSIHDVLKSPTTISKQSAPTQLPPLSLMDPYMVQEYTPCTLHGSVLPSDLARRLYYDLLDKSRSWSRNKWWLFDKVVESPHLTSFFVRDQVGGDGEWKQAAQHWYNGRPTPPPDKFTVEMEEACLYVEAIVNQELSNRQRFSLEWAGSDWKANVAAINCYNGPKESVGFHSDQLTYLGPYPTIASLSLGTTRNFRLREVVPARETGDRKARTFDIPLSHNSLIIMHASAQENFKHSIPPQRVVDVFRAPINNEDSGEEVQSNVTRINITFRFYRPDFSPLTTPRCKCNVPCILRPDMKGRDMNGVNKYWWTCYAGAQNDGKGCSYWEKMDMSSEGRGPCMSSVI